MFSMKKFQYISALGLAITVLAGLQIGLDSSTIQAIEPTFFTYQLKDGVTVDGKQQLFVPLGKAYSFSYSVDNVGKSGPGKLIFEMYSNGTFVWRQAVNVTANGTFSRKIPAPLFTKTTKNYGPFYLCASERLASGKAELKAPCAQWKWIAIEVPIAYVSNGCGGMTGIDLIDKAQAKLLNTRKFNGVVISYKDACDVHDAAYSGVVVRDKFFKKVINYLRWTRGLIDSRLELDIQQLCIKRFDPTKVSATLVTLLSPCISMAHRYYLAVRAVGRAFFDANPAKPGIQSVYEDPLDPIGPYGFGVERDNR